MSTQPNAPTAQEIYIAQSLMDELPLCLPHKNSRPQRTIAERRVRGMILAAFSRLKQPAPEKIAEPIAPTVPPGVDDAHPVITTANNGLKLLTGHADRPITPAMSKHELIEEIALWKGRYEAVHEQADRLEAQLKQPSADAGAASEELSRWMNELADDAEQAVVDPDPKMLRRVALALAALRPAEQTATERDGDDLEVGETISGKIHFNMLSYGVYSSMIVTREHAQRIHTKLGQVLGQSPEPVGAEALAEGEQYLINVEIDVAILGLKQSTYFLTPQELSYPKNIRLTHPIDVLESLKPVIAKLKAAQPAPVRAEAERLDWILTHCTVEYHTPGVYSTEMHLKTRGAVDKAMGLSATAASAPAQSYIRHDGDVEIHDMLKRMPAQSAEPDAKRDAGDDVGLDTMAKCLSDRIRHRGLFYSEGIIKQGLEESAQATRRRCKEAVEDALRKHGRAKDAVNAIYALLQSEFGDK